MTSVQTGNSPESEQAEERSISAITEFFPTSITKASASYDAFRARMLSLHKNGKKPNSEEFRLIALMRLSDDILRFCQSQGLHTASYDMERRYAIASLLNEAGELEPSTIPPQLYEDIAFYIKDACWTCVKKRATKPKVSDGTDESASSNESDDGDALKSLLSLVSIHPEKRKRSYDDNAHRVFYPVEFTLAKRRIESFEARLLVKEYLKQPLTPSEENVIRVKELSEEMLLIDTKCGQAFKEYSHHCVSAIGHLLTDYGEAIPELNTNEASYNAVEIIQMAKRHVRDEAMHIILEANQIHLRKLSLNPATPEARRYNKMYALPDPTEYGLEPQL